MWMASRAPNGDFLDQNKLPPVATQLLVNYQSNLKWLTTFNLICIYIYMLGTIKQIQANVARVCFVCLQRCARQLKQRTRRLDFISWRTFWVGFVDHIRHLDASNTNGAQSTYIHEKQHPMGPDFYQLRNSSPLTYRCTQIKDPRHFWGVGLSYLRYPPPLFVWFRYVSRSGMTSKNNTYTSVAAEVIISKPHKK